MANSTPQEKTLNSDANEFPSAKVVDRPASLLGVTRLWWLTLCCLLLAIGLVFWSMPSAGTSITIAFPEGHGLQPEDAVRYRGIDVGVVESVRLAPALNRVDVHVNLIPSAHKLAVAGSRFWIVRPQLSIAGVSGLDTAVGHKYIQVIPGDTAGRPVKFFTGLAQPPADTSGQNGIEILLQADSRHSVTPGSAIHFRGVDIGHILSVELSSDSRHVEIRGKIGSAYRQLVTTQSRFWATGGVDFDFSLREGLKLETESLDTLARGGVSMLVIGSGATVGPGYVFPLAETMDKDWQVKADAFRNSTTNMRGCANFEARWKEKILYRDWEKSQFFSGIAIRKTSGGSYFIIPADIIELQSRAAANTLTIEQLSDDGRRLPIDVGPAPTDSPVVRIDIELPQQDLIFTNEFSATSQPAAAVVVRKSRDNQSYLQLPIAETDFSLSIADDNRNDQVWRLPQFSGDRDVWHGCPVLLAADSTLLGMLLIDDNGPRVYLLNPNE